MAKIEISNILTVAVPVSISEALLRERRPMSF